MDLIDDDGNLLGVVNVVDALVVLLVLAVVAAGVALVFQPEPEPEPESELATTDATLDLGAQPAYLADEIQVGDTYSPAENTELEVTEVYRTPQGDQTRVVLGVTLQGPVAGDTIQYGDAPPRLGRSLDVQTDTYQVSGSIRDLGTGPELTTTDVLVASSVSAETAARIEEGDTYTVGTHEVATVESVTAYGTDDPDRTRVFVGLSLSTIRDGGDARFGATTIQEGANVPVRTDDYEFTGDVRRVGTTEQRGEPATRIVQLQLRDVPPQLADSVADGMTETVRGDTVARITDVERESATVVLTSQDGQIYERDHPVNQDLTITADLAVRETATGIAFKGRTIKQGSTVTLALGDVTVRATVIAT